MSPQPVADSTKDDLRNAYAAANGPFSVSVDGIDDFVVMRVFDLEGESGLTEQERMSLLAGYRDYLDGNVIDAREMVSELREKYGL